MQGYSEKRADGVQSVARIALPFAVKINNVQRSSLEWVGNAACIIYIDNNAYEELYGAEEYDVENEMCKGLDGLCVIQNRDMAKVKAHVSIDFTSF